MFLNPRETATVLAALRYFQANHSDAVEACSTHFNGVNPMTDKQIDSLCERINTDVPPKILTKPLGKGFKGTVMKKGTSP